jgi:hypothetical protein
MVRKVDSSAREFSPAGKIHLFIGSPSRPASKACFHARSPPDAAYLAAAVTFTKMERLERKISLRI